MQDLPRSYHHGNLPPALVATAVTMIGESGDWRFTLRDLAARAGVSHAASYKHFADKSALLAAVAAEGFTRLHAALADVVENWDGRADGRARCHALAEAYVLFGEANPGLFRLMSGADGGAGAGLDAPAAQVRRLLRAACGGQGEASGMAFWALLHGMTLLWLDGCMEGVVPAAVVEALLERV